MKLAALALLIGIGAASAEQDALIALSDVQYQRHEVLFEPVGAYDAVRRVVRLRLVANEIADQSNFGFDVIERDIQSLCDTEGLRIVSKFAPNATEVVISVAAEETVFGEPAPSIVQYFDVFSVVDGTCIWGGL